MADPKFLRIGYTQYSKLGLRRKNKQKYRKSKGGENKIRLKMKGHLRNVNIGFRSEKNSRDLINGLRPVLIKSIEELKNIGKNEIAVLAKVGRKKKIEIAEYSVKNNIRIQNLNSKKFLEKTQIQIKTEKESKIKRSEKKKLRDKKAKEAEKKKSEEESKEKEKKEDKKETIEESVKNNESDIKVNTEEKK